jgi:uncharacterized protein (DUF433 family)
MFFTYTYLVSKLEAINMESPAMHPKYVPEEVIQATPGICGGYPRVRNTRIPVWTLVSLRNQGATDRELLDDYPSLKLEDLTAVWEYYYNHKLEVDRIIMSIDE